jgi:hypothetical protein
LLRREGLNSSRRPLMYVWRPAHGRRATAGGGPLRAANAAHGAALMPGATRPRGAGCLGQRCPSRFRWAQLAKRRSMQQLIARCKLRLRGQRQMNADDSARWQPCAYEAARAELGLQLPCGCCDGARLQPCIHEVGRVVRLRDAGGSRVSSTQPSLVVAAGGRSRAACHVLAMGRRRSVQHRQRRAAQRARRLAWDALRPSAQPPPPPQRQVSCIPHGEPPFWTRCEGT